MRRQWWHQTFVEEGDLMPSLADIGAATTQAQTKDFEWVLLAHKADMPDLKGDTSNTVTMESWTGKRVEE
jgi:hypothetical protein